MLYTTAVLEAPRLIRVMMHGSDENRQVRWRGTRGRLEGKRMAVSERMAGVRGQMEGIEKAGQRRKSRGE